MGSLNEAEVRYTIAEDDCCNNFAVYDRDHHKVGRLKNAFLDDEGNPHYAEVEIGLLHLHSVLIPLEEARADREKKELYVPYSADKIKRAPVYDDSDADLLPKEEADIRSYFGLGPESSPMPLHHRQ